ERARPPTGGAPPRRARWPSAPPRRPSAGAPQRARRRAARSRRAAGRALARRRGSGDGSSSGWPARRGGPATAPSSARPGAPDRSARPEGRWSCRASGRTGTARPPPRRRRPPPRRPRAAPPRTRRERGRAPTSVGAPVPAVRDLVDVVPDQLLVVVLVELLADDSAGELHGDLRHLGPELLEHAVALGADLLLRADEDLLRLLLRLRHQVSSELVRRLARLLD